MHRYRPRWNSELQPLVAELKKYSNEEQYKILKLALDSARSNSHIQFDEKKKVAELTSARSNRIQTLEDLIEHCDIDLESWEVDRYVVNKWEVGTKIDGLIITEPLFQVKAWLKRLNFKKELANIKAEMMNEMRNEAPIYVRYERKDINAKKNLLEINIFDLHFGKLCWGEETGDNYDTKIAEKRFFGALQTLLDRTSNFDFQKILFPIGNDFFNSDNLRNQTTAGTPQDEDLRWQKTFRAGRKMVVKAIKILASVAPVEVVIVQGNHDWERSFYLGDALECWFDRCPEINVNNQASPRKYYQFGKCMIGYTHGNNEKVANLPLIASHEQPKMWADTKYREMHLGHLHHKRDIKWVSTQEYNGLVCRYMRSLSGTDAWHNQKGYIGSIQSAEAFVWNKDEGLIAQLSYNL
jgi:hypothetical protein